MMTMTYTQESDLIAEIDRRGDTRVDSWRAVRAFEPFSGRTVSGVTVNESGGGMCLRLYSSVALRPGRFLTVAALPTQLAALDPSTQPRPARVVWTRPDPDEVGAQLVGVQLYAAVQAAAA